MRYLITIIIALSTPGAFAQSKDKYDRIQDSMIRNGESEKLIPYFLHELTIKPRNELLLRRLGYLYITRNQPRLAEKYYLDALNVNSKCSHCYLNIAKIYANENNTEKAFESLQKAIALTPADAEIYATRAKLKEMGGDKFGALADINKAILRDSGNADYYIDRADLNSGQGYFYIALSDLSKAIELAPRHYYPFYKRSELYYGQQMITEAMADINNAIKLDSTRHELYTARGAMYGFNKQHDKSLADYSKSIAMNPTDYFSYYNRSLERYALEDMDGSCADMRDSYDLLKKYDSANTLLEEIEYSLETYCDSTKAGFYYQRGIAFYNLGQYDRAVGIYTAGLNKFPGNSMTLSFRGNAYFQQKDYTHALSDYDASINNKENVYRDIAANQKHTQLNKESLETYVKGFLASMYVSIAESKFALGKYDESLLEINKGIDIAPDIKEFGKEIYFNVRGSIFLALGKYQNALDDFEKCIKFNSIFSIAYVNRAIAKMNLANRLRMKSSFISGGVNDKAFMANWTFPSNLSVKKSDAGLNDALADCSLAIGIDPNMDFAYYIRGQIKKMLLHNDFCKDIIRAKELGYPVEEEMMKGCGR